MTKMSKSLHEEFAQFFEHPTRDSFRDLIKKNFGENRQIDFKEEWPDLPKIARHILALGNSGGGALIIGVAEKDDGSIEATGILAIKDKTDIIQGVRKFLPHQLEYEILDFSFHSSDYQAIQGKNFQVVLIEDLPQYLPFVCQADTDKLRRAAIYVRRSTNSEEASYEELQDIINRRIETAYSSSKELNLDEEMAELKALYSQLRPSRDRRITMAGFGLLFEANPNYPKEDFDAFTNRMIGLKKQRIERLLKVKDNK